MSRDDGSAHDQPALAVGVGYDRGSRELAVRGSGPGSVHTLPVVSNGSGCQLEMPHDTVVRVEERVVVSVRAPEPGGDEIIPALRSLSLRETLGPMRLLDAPTDVRSEPPVRLEVEAQRLELDGGPRPPTVGIPQCDRCQVNLPPRQSRCLGCLSVLQTKGVTSDGPLEAIMGC